MGDLEWWFARNSSFFPPFLSSISSSRNIQQMHGSSSYYSTKTISSVALDVGYIGITKSVVFAWWAIVRHMHSTNTGHFTSASIYGGGGWWQEYRFLRWCSRMELQGLDDRVWVWTGRIA